MKRAFALLFAALLVGCGESGDGTPGGADAPKAAAPDVSGESSSDGRLGTPVEDRVATIGLLNKRNNLTQNLLLKSGESRRVGNVIVKLAVCEKTKPWERPQEEGAFVQVFVEERASASDKLAWRKVFSGWLFRNSPSLNVVEHPVYDVWIKSCAMKFPGEEARPASAASASSAPKASGSASASPAPAPAPSSSPPTPSAPAAE